MFINGYRSGGLLLVLAVWDVFWKGVGLWRSVKNKQKVWFVALLLLNTAGVLPLIYLWFVDKGVVFQDYLGKKKTRKGKK